jgi:hypothetical protein
MEHGGRIQAQGGNIEESESWDQGTPLLAVIAYGYLENLKIKIGRREADLRSVGFDQAGRYVDRMLARGGTDYAPPIIRKQRRKRELKSGIGGQSPLLRGGDSPIIFLPCVGSLSEKAIRSHQGRIRGG